MIDNNDDKMTTFVTLTFTCSKLIAMSVFSYKLPK